MFHALSIALLAAAQPPAACHLIFPVAPDEAAARRIAEAVIAARPHRSRRRYLLHVAPAPDDAAKWQAFESLPPPERASGPGWVYVSSGGGGVAMRIDRCTGEVSGLAYAG